MAKILLIDDSNFIIKTTAEFLTSEGHEVVGSGNDGREGLQLYRNLKPDLVLLDLTMPNEGGRECLRKIRDEDPNARVVVVSAIREASIVNECMANGAKGYIEKPMKFRSKEFCDQFRAELSKALAA
jgi:two-component system chemotaxis response regulator CheY